MKVTSKKLIGRVEFVDFPDLGLSSVPSKIDTGAYTSSLHCQDIYESKEGGKKILCFKPLDPAFHNFPEHEICLRNYTRRKIKNSFGQIETRFIIKTTMIIAGKSVETELSLSDRAKLKYPVLLGRRVLSKGFVIDVCKRNVADRNIELKLIKTENREKE